MLSTALSSKYTQFWGHKCGKVYYLGGYINFDSDMPNNTQIAQTNLSPVYNGYASVISSAGKLGRLVLRPSGRLDGEYPFIKNEYYSFTISGFLI